MLSLIGLLLALVGEMPSRVKPAPPLPATRSVPVDELTSERLRPTPETVAKGVEESRAQYVEAYDPEQHAQALRQRLNAAKSGNRPIDEQRELERQISATERRVNKRFESTPDVQDAKPLYPMDLEAPKIGTVGFIGPKSFGNQSTGAIRCLQVLSANRFVGRYEEHYSLKQGGSHFVRSPSYIFVGVSVDDAGEKIAAGKLHTVKFNGVITGRAEYSTGQGERLAYVIEKLDPDVPFN